MFGVGLVCGIGHVIKWFIDETGYSNLLTNSVCSGTKACVYRAIVSLYSNSRGRDSSYKKNAMAPPNTEQTLWARLEIASVVEKTKHKKAKAAKSVIAKKPPAAKHCEVVKAVNATLAEKENTTPPEKELSIVPWNVDWLDCQGL